ncbi:NTPase [Thermococcus sp. 2319x1]|uniref:NTPase n=1 Tax=Thermococcus sp. 2319x1 TaxID=1674923 RepID=UPI0019399AD4|nr:NTPase [Thermococcus sp. 2319x1]
MSLMKIFITGLPGAGKTTLVLRVAEELKAYNLKIGGFITQEVRENGRRVGFKIKALDTGEEGILAWIGEGHPRVGKYVVNLEDLNRVGVLAIQRALKDADLIIIDEIGAMEYKSREFAEAVEKAVKSEKPLLATVHRNYAKRFRNYGKLYVLTPENREHIRQEIIHNLKAILKP